jgi:hypothetical protein
MGLAAEANAVGLHHAPVGGERRVLVVDVPRVVAAGWAAIAEAQRPDVDCRRSAAVAGLAADSAWRRPDWPNRLPPGLLPQGSKSFAWAALRFFPRPSLRRIILPVPDRCKLHFPYRRERRKPQRLLRQAVMMIFRHRRITIATKNCRHRDDNCCRSELAYGVGPQLRGFPICRLAVFGLAMCQGKSGLWGELFRLFGPF